MQSLAKTAADNYDDEEIRDSFVNIAIDLYVLVLECYGTVVYIFLGMCQD